MAERRSLTEGLKATPPVDSLVAHDFIHAGKPAAPRPVAAKEITAAPQASTRAQISTRIRADYAAALKRASLERQLSGTEPNTLQDILEQAIEPWLRANGYIS
jgi:hypothetical protein